MDASKKATTWRWIKMVPLDKQLTVLKFVIYGVGNSMPLKRNSSITVRDFEENLTHNWEIDDPRIDLYLSSPLNTAMTLPMVIVLEKGRIVRYRVPLIMAKIVTRIANGMIVEKMALQKDSNFQPLTPFQMSFHIEKNKIKCDDNVILLSKLGKMLEKASW